MGLVFIFASQETLAQAPSTPPSCLIGEGLSAPAGVTADTYGNVYVSDMANHIIIKVSPTVRTIIAGTYGQTGFNTVAEGSVALPAKLNTPTKIFYSPGNGAYGYLYIADSGNNAIRRIDLYTNTIKTMAGGGSPVAGQPGQSGFSDGNNLATALFNDPRGIYVEPTNLEIAVADSGNNALRLIKPDFNQVITIAGNPSTPGTISCATTGCPAITNFQQCSAINLNSPHDVIFRRGSIIGQFYNFYIADTGTHSIRYIGYDSSSSFCQGNLVAGSGSAGYNDGIGNQVVQFRQPVGLADADFIAGGQTMQGISHLFITDSGNNVVRYLTLSPGGTGSPPTASTFAGVPQSSGAYAEGTANVQSTARFNRPLGIFVRGMCAGSGNCFFPYANGAQFYVTDSGNRIIRQINGNGYSSVWQTSRFFTNPVDVILKLSAQTGALGEVYNQQSFSEGVCYSDLFAGVIPSSADRTCPSNGANDVLKLQSQTNSRAEINSLSNYNVNICYGGLTCTNVAGNAACPAGSSEIVSLSANTNANIETALANSYTSSSAYKVCCSNNPNPPPPPPPPAPTPAIISIGWAYYNGGPIPSSTLICSNSVIYAYTQTSNLVDGSPVTFNFYDEDTLPNQLIFGPTTVTTVNNIAAFPVNFADPNVANALHQFLSGSGDDVELLFEASIPAETRRSYSIRYTEDTNLCTYNPPTISVNAPVHQGVYFANTLIDFSASCSSQSGPMTYNWQILQNGNTITNTNPIFQQTFTQGGQATVTLTCTNLQGQSVSRQVQMLVVASPFAFVYINDPAFNGVEYTTPSGVAYFPREVSFEATQTFAVDTTATCTINCIGGNCPAQTQNSPSSCTGVNGIAGGPLSIALLTGNVWSGMNFDWTFWDDDWTNSGSIFDGVGKWFGSLEYDDVSENINDKHISVSVTATNGAASATASFQRDFTLGRCLNNGNTLLNSAGQTQSTTQANVCNGADGVPNSGDECCPTGQDCVNTDGGSYSCEFLTNPIARCEDFTNANSCNANTNPAYPLASNGGVLPTSACTLLRCSWIDDDSGCGLRRSQYPVTSSSGACPTQGCVVSDCTWTTTQTECVNGRKTITYTGSSSIGGLPICAGGSNTCTREPVTVPCGSLNFELDFFGIKQFITTAIIVALFYLICGMRRKD